MPTSGIKTMLDKGITVSYKVMVRIERKPHGKQKASEGRV